MFEGFLTTIQFQIKVLEFVNLHVLMKSELKKN